MNKQQTEIGLEIINQINNYISSGKMTSPEALEMIANLASTCIISFQKDADSGNKMAAVFCEDIIEIVERLNNK